MLPIPKGLEYSEGICTRLYLTVCCFDLFDCKHDLFLDF